MRLATWNVNSARARIDRIVAWLERSDVDVLAMQETKCKDDQFPAERFTALGYEVAHHGHSQWNGVAIVSRVGLEDIACGFPGQPTWGDPAQAEARAIAATCGGVRVVSIYAPNGRRVNTPFYEAKLVWYERLLGWLEQRCAPEGPLVIGGDFNVAPDDRDVWDARAVHGGTHVSPREREMFRALCGWGLVDVYRARHDEPGRFTWWDYQAGAFHKNFGMRIDHLVATRSVADRIVWAEIDREARKGKPIPSDHAPLVIDLDEPGLAFDAGWASADERIAARIGKAIAKGSASS